MDEETRKKIIDWIFKHHEHHEQGDWQCKDWEYPYVNSLELEKFIKELK